MLKGAKSAFASASRTALRASFLYSPRAVSCGSATPLAAVLRSYSAFPAISSASNSQFTRLYSNSATQRIVDEPARTVEYKDVKKMTTSNDPSVVLVDVREPHEFEQGHIPNAVNIPFKSMPGALGLEASEFESTLGFPKPDPSKNLVFYCQGGVRSTSSEQLASTFGYRNRSNYTGSFADWAEHEGIKPKGLEQ